MKLKMRITALPMLLLATATTAHADLVGSQMLIDVYHSGLADSNAGGVHKYGQVQSFYTAHDLELVVSSPADASGYDNAIKINFVEFSFGGLDPDSFGQVTLSEIVEDVLPGSVAVFSGGNDITASATTFQDALTATWTVSNVMNSTTGGPTVTIAWNSVPAPGALALLGMAGLISQPRRRRR